MRNFLVGLVYGGAVSLAALAMLSYFVPQKVSLTADLLAPAPQQIAPAGPAPAEPAPADPAPPAPAEPAPVDPAPADPAPTPAAPTSAAPASPEPAAPAQPAATQPAPAQPSATKPAPANPPPLQAYAAPFDAAQTTGAPAKALFAIVLIDTGHPKVDRAVAASLPFPVSFAIDPEASYAAEAMTLYRAAGKEVIALPQSLPTNAGLPDIERVLRGYAALLPESVAMLSAPEGGFQDARPLASMVVPEIGAQGRGVLLMDKGMNSAAQIAQREGIAYALVSKVLDGAGESIPVMRQYLDRAAFKAAQNGAAVVMGTSQPDTLAALTEWSLEGRAGNVTLAPISALMQPPRP